MIKGRIALIEINCYDCEKYNVHTTPDQHGRIPTINNECDFTATESFTIGMVIYSISFMFASLRLTLLDPDELLIVEIL